MFTGRNVNAKSEKIDLINIYNITIISIDVDTFLV